MRKEAITGTNDKEGFFLSRYSLTINKGSSVTIRATVTPKGTATVSWSSENPAVATVDAEGLVTAVGAGETVLTAKAGSQSRTCAVSVLSAIQSVKLNETSLELSKTQTFQLTAEVAPDDINVGYTVEWNSSDPSVATVNEEGLVTAVGGGECVITVKAGDVFASCDVLVSLKATGIQVTPASASLQVNKTLQLTVAPIPDDATDELTYEWSTSSALIATVDENGLVTTHGEGDVTITVIAGEFSAQSVLHVAGGYLVTKAATMTGNYFPISGWYNNSNVSSLSALTFECLFRGDAWRNQISGGTQIVNSLFGVEGYWLIRAGDVGLSENQIQLATNHGNATSTIKPAAGQWYHLAVVYDTASKDVRFYLDGELAYSQAGFATQAADLSKVCSHDNVGCSIGHAYEENRYFNGAMAEVRVWKTARTADEIKANMYSVTPTSDLLGYWKFNEGSGNTVTDYSGNGLNLTAASALSWEDVQLPESD